MNKQLSSTNGGKPLSFSPVWIVPLVALAVAIWLAIQEQFAKGELITIEFAQATDLIAGETQIRLNDVTVGVVKKVRLAEDLQSVLVTARMEPEISAYLTENARFWIVTPRISTTGVSNLGTLISGIYIVMDPGEPSKSTTRFTGLDEPPAFESNERGRQFLLKAEQLGSLDIGSAVLFRQIRVGEVTGYKLAENAKEVEISIYIRAPHDSLVSERSRFWNVSGFDVSLGMEGVRANIASLASLVSGGVSFDNSAVMGDPAPAPENTRFNLYADKESVLEGRYSIRYFYLLKFQGSARGLTIGAPVEFKGIKVGEVIDVVLTSSRLAEGQLEVYIALEPQRFNSEASPSREEMDVQLDEYIAQGLRATMATGSLLTGSKFIDLIFEKNLPEKNLLVEAEYSIIPTVYESPDKIARQAATLIEKVNRIPITKISENLAGSLESLNNILIDFEKLNTAAKLDGTLRNAELTMAKANRALEQLNTTMKSVDSAVSPDSATRYELNDSIRKVGEAARALEEFLEELNRKPNALITGGRKSKEK